MCKITTRLNEETKIKLVRGHVELGPVKTHTCLECVYIRTYVHAYIPYAIKFS